ncbi:MAG TPA: DUF883 C-terminal domain-containing protein [Myxococcota bacterium]|jgi:ElaB/YqjD/DUF883 family membrane-anchored ribosome-binding protein
MQTASERMERAVPILERPEVKERVEEVRGRLQELDVQVRRVVQERPLVAMGVALVVGYALARLLARR